MSNKADKVYLDIAKDILENGLLHKDRTGTGTKRIFGVLSKYDLNEGFPMLTTRKLSLRIAAEELRWMLAGSTNVADLQEKNIKIWDGNGSAEECAKFGRIPGDLGPIYGHQWRNFNATKRPALEIDIMKTRDMYKDNYSQDNKRWVNKEYWDDGHDQIKELIETIQKNPDSRRMIVCGWNAMEKALVNPPPCHHTFQVSVMDGTLHLLLMQRSGDLFLGIPTNIMFYSLLMHVLAKVSNLKVGVFSHMIADAHIYLDHIEQMTEQVSRKPYELPTISINDRLAGKGFDGLMDFKYEDVVLTGYVSHPPLKGKMSV